MSITFSAIIPCYNGSRYIVSAIESVLKQTRKFDEIIISDDNSSDDTVEIAKRYEKYGIRIVINKNGPSGFVNGWNNAIRLATCDYISILHQDDVLYSEFLEKIEQSLQEHPDVMHAFSVCDYIDGEGNVVRHPFLKESGTFRYNQQEYIQEYMDCGNHSHIHRCPGVVTRRSVFEYCTYREEAGHIADDDFFYRVAQYTDVIGILEPLAAYRLHDASETGKLSDMRLVRRLSRDQLFLLKCRYYREKLSRSSYLKLCKMHYRDARRLLGYSLMRFDLVNMTYSIYCIVMNMILSHFKS